MSASPIQRDERTIAVENASYHWAYSFLSFGLLGLVAFRSFVYREQPWDLLALVILGGFVSTVYQYAHQVLNRRWVYVVAVSMLMAALLGAAIAWLSHFVQ